MEPSSITESKHAYLAAIAAPVFQEEGDSLLPLVTRCENSLLEEDFLPKGCFQNNRLALHSFSLQVQLPGAAAPQVFQSPAIPPEILRLLEEDQGS